MFRLACVLLGLAALEAAAGDYTFTLDGAPCEPRVVSLSGTPAAPAEGDLIWVARYPVVLGPPGRYAFHQAGEHEGRLLVERGEQRATIAVRVFGRWVDQAKAVVDPLTTLDGAALRELRGVSWEEWTEQSAAQLAQLDLEHCAVSIAHGVGPNRALPALPEGIRYLQLGGSMSPAFESLDGLERQTALRALQVNARPLDLERLRGLVSLRVLDLDGSPAEGALAPLSGLVDLRHLDLSRCRSVTGFDALAPLKQMCLLQLWGTGVADLGFAREMRALRELDLRDCPVKDLGPLGGLLALERIEASASGVETLPRDRLPALRSLTLYSTSVGDAEVARFAEQHPEAAIAHRWKTALEAAARTATRLRVRTGGTCHRQPDGEKTLFERDGAAEVAALLERIEIEEGESGDHCMCCGTPSFELYDAGGQLLITLGFHHGQSVRWSEGWPGDGKLSVRSAEALCRWLAEHGHDGPLRELLAEQARQRGAERLMARYMELLPPEVLAALRRARGPKDAAAAFGQVADGEARALLLYQLLGVSSSPWNQSGAPFDSIATQVLASCEPQALDRATRAALDNPERLAGVARQLLGDLKGHVAVPRDTLDAVLPTVARWALAHPHEVNRRRAVAQLHRLGGDAARDALRDLLAGRLVLRELDAEAPSSPAGMVSFTPMDGEARGASDRAYAAWALGKLGDRDSRAAIEALAAGATGRDAEVLAEALALLE